MLSVPTISHDTCERVVTFCYYRWSHITRLTELWRVVSTDTITRHVWKSCDVLLVRMMSHHTSERVLKCYQYGWSYTTRLKELWRVISTDDIKTHVWNSCDVLSLRMISHHTSERVVTCYQYGWSYTTRLKELWCVISTDDLTQSSKTVFWSPPLVCLDAVQLTPFMSSSLLSGVFCFYSALLFNISIANYVLRLLTILIDTLGR